MEAQTFDEDQRLVSLRADLEKMEARFKFFNKKYVEINTQPFFYQNGIVAWNEIDKNNNLFYLNEKRKWCKKEIIRMKKLIEMYTH